MVVYCTEPFIMLKFLNVSHGNVHTIAYVLAAVSIVGYGVSFLRDRVFAHYFGAGELLDIYIASFRIPDTLFIVATAFISVYALLPMFEEKQRKSPEEFREFINTAFYFLLLFLVFGGTAIFFCIPLFTDIFFSGFSDDARDLFILFSRVFLIQAFLFSVSSFYSSLLQLKRRFFLYALLPIFYNFGIIFGAAALYPLYGPVGLLCGVLIGIIFNVCIQIPIVARNGCVPVPAPTRRMAREMWRTVKLSVPRASAILSVAVSNIIIFGSLVSLSGGAVSVYYFAENLRSVPLVIVGTAYAVAAFPILVSCRTTGNMEKFRAVTEGAFRRLLFFILPLIAYIFILRDLLISFFFETGLFTAETTVITGTILGIFVYSAFATGVLILSARVLYAYGKSLVPFAVFLTMSVLKIAAVYLVIDFLRVNREPLLAVLEFTGLNSGGFGMLFAVIAVIVALETLAALVIFILLVRIVRLRLRPIVVACAQHSIATAALVVSLIITEMLFGSIAEHASLTVGNFGTIAAMSAVGVCAWYGALRLMRNEESALIREKISSYITTVRRRV